MSLPGQSSMYRLGLSLMCYERIDLRIPTLFSVKDQVALVTGGAYRTSNHLGVLFSNARRMI